MTEPAAAPADPGARAPEANVTDPAPGSPDYILAVMKQLEEDVHADEGWDNDPKLYALVGHGDEANAWTWECLIVDPVLWHLPGTRTPTETMAFYMRFLAGWDVRPGLPKFPIEGLLDPPLRAVVMCAEAWTLLGSVGERGTGRLADHPGAVETRHVSAVLPDGTVAFVERTRGRTPAHSGWRMNPVTGDQATFGPVPMGRLRPPAGAMINMMRALVNAVNAAGGRPLIEYFYGNDDERRFLERAKGGPL